MEYIPIFIYTPPKLSKCRHKLFLIPYMEHMGTVGKLNSPYGKQLVGMKTESCIWINHMVEVDEWGTILVAWICECARVWPISSEGRNWQIMHELGLANWQINWANLAKYGTKTGFQLGGPIGSAKLDECTKWYHDRVYGRNGQNIYRYIIAFTSQHTPLERTTCLEIYYTQ